MNKLIFPLLAIIIILIILLAVYGHKRESVASIDYNAVAVQEWGADQYNERNTPGVEKKSARDPEMSRKKYAAVRTAALVLAIIVFLAAIKCSTKRRSDLPKNPVLPSKRQKFYLR